MGTTKRLVRWIGRHPWQCHGCMAFLGFLVPVLIVLLSTHGDYDAIKTWRWFG